MTNAEIIAQIRAEIERRVDILATVSVKQAKDGDSEMSTYYHGKAVSLEELIPFLSTLESEKQMDQEGLVEEVKRYYSDNFAYISSDQPTLSILTNVARHFYDLGCRRTSEKFDEIEYERQREEKSEKPGEGWEDVDFDSEITHIWGKCAAEPNDQIACLHIESFIEIARHFAQWGAEHLADARKMISGRSEIPNDAKAAAEHFYPQDAFDTQSVRELGIACFVDGAKWHADHAPLPEDTVLFNNGVEEGKMLMMEEAVEIGTTEICWEQDGDRVFPTFDPPAEDLLMPGVISQKFNDGDKVRVIIIKKED